MVEEALREVTNVLIRSVQSALRQPLLPTILPMLALLHPRQLLPCACCSAMTPMSNCHRVAPQTALTAPPPQDTPLSPRK